jgi:hypothetical protein
MLATDCGRDRLTALDTLAVAVADILVALG